MNKCVYIYIYTYIYIYIHTYINSLPSQSTHLDTDPFICVKHRERDVASGHKGITPLGIHPESKKGFPKMGVPPKILWTDEILHQVETTPNHCLVLTGESSFQGFLGGARFRPSTVCVCILGSKEQKQQLNESVKDKSTRAVIRRTPQL